MANAENWRVAGELALLFVATVAMTAGLVWLLRPILLRYALARPNERTIHLEPTPQGGGIAVMGAMIVAIFGAAVFAPHLLNDPLSLAVVFACAIGLALVGVTDDIRPLAAIPRLLLQVAAVAIVIAALPPELRIIPKLPWWLERAAFLIGGVWFVNLVNFMDGIDWMTVAEVVPLTAGLTFFGLMGALPKDGTLVALALCGAIVGFAPFNRPVARLFLGDVGSLPIGLLLAWLLISLAGGGHLAAAILLPLYYVADATLTLLRRLIDGEPILQAHRSHFFQRAMIGGFGVYRIVGRVFALNLILIALAAVTFWIASFVVHLIALIAGAVLVGALLTQFNRAGR